MKRSPRRHRGTEVLNQIFLCVSVSLWQVFPEAA